MAKNKTPTEQTPAPAAPATNGEAKAPKGPRCPVSRKTFREAAPKSVAVTIAGTLMGAGLKEFATGSFGYYANGKITLDVGGTPVDFQVGLNLTAVGSKEAPAE